MVIIRLIYYFYLYDNFVHYDDHDDVDDDVDDDYDGHDDVDVDCTYDK